MRLSYRINLNPISREIKKLVNMFDFGEGGGKGGGIGQLNRTVASSKQSQKVFIRKDPMAELATAQQFSSEVKCCV